jgi:hypothetical protein
MQQMSGSSTNSDSWDRLQAMCVSLTECLESICPIIDDMGKAAKQAARERSRLDLERQRSDARKKRRREW